MDIPERWLPRLITSLRQYDGHKFSKDLISGITVGLATDGPASQNTQDLFEEMKFCGLIHKDKTGDVEFMKTRELLELATCEGAKAMHRPDVAVILLGYLKEAING